MKKKSLALLLAIALVVVGAVAGTVAWLTAQTAAVKNTFTTSDITIELTETPVENYKMIPGCTIAKDPKVTVKTGSEACYLFVKLEKSENFNQYMTYDMAKGWAALPNTTDVYYREVAAATADTTFEVLQGNQVSVKGKVTKEQMNALTETTNPTLTVTAYASQLQKNANTNFTVEEAWANIAPAP